MSQQSTTGILLKLYAKNELKNKAHVVSYILFALILLALFSFTGGPLKTNPHGFYILQSLVVTLFSIQLSLTQCFQADTEDQFHHLLKSLKINKNSWFLAKFLHSLLNGFLILVPALAFGSLFQQETFMHFAIMFFVASMMLIGLTSLGILLSAMTLNAQGKELIFPLLFYPLTVPVLLLATKASYQLIPLDSLASIGADGQWLGILLGIDIIYLILAFLFFEELA